MTNLFSLLYKNKKGVNLFLGLLFCLVSCSLSETKKALNYADNLKDAIDKFETSRKEVVETVGNAVEKTSGIISNESNNLPKIADDWENQWNSIMKRFSDLETNFNRVGQASNDYFEKLNETINNIGNESIKMSELQKNNNLKERYTEAYTEAANNIKKIKSVLDEGGDYHKVLLASAMRQKITANIDELKSMSLNAKKILDDLEHFTIEGKKLISY